MNFDEFTTTISNIGKLDKIEDVRSQLLELQQSVEADYTSLTDITKERDQLKNDNEALRNANNKLWLQIGKPIEDGAGGTDEQPETNTLTYDKLFDENGGLK